MLEINHLTISVDNKIMIDNLRLVLNEHDKLAIIGEEGNGKSTLLKVILQDCPYASYQGDINTHKAKIGYLKQTLTKEELSLSVHDYLFPELEFYFNKCKEFYILLEQFQLSDEIEEQTLKTLSGGEKVKVQLLKIMLEEADILLLDEPTNDLDLNTLQWLEHFINQCEKGIIFVSHDETLLSHCANQILHLELRKKKTEPIYTWKKIDYDAYVEKRLSHLQKLTQVAHSEKREHKKKMDRLMRQMQQVDHQLNTISRQDPRGAALLKKKMKNVKSLEKRITNEEVSEVPDVEESINLFFPECSLPSRKEVLNLTLTTLQIKNKILAKNIKLEIFGPKHLVIIGKNGIGKTTLMNHIWELLKERQDIRPAYMKQNYEEHFNEKETPLDFLCPNHERDLVSKTRQYLGNLNFTRKEMTSPISELSGGSKAKLILLSLMMKNCNVLLLDEPTRNVSPLSNPIIRRALRDFQGCIISISHDRKYIEEVCDSVYELKTEGIVKVR